MPDINGAGVYQCEYCPFVTCFICNGSETNPDIVYIQFVIDNYVLELDMHDKICNLFVLGQPDCPLVITLSFLPDLNPSNAKQWLDKLLLLKPFF